jgi:hypothetical protein
MDERKPSISSSGFHLRRVSARTAADIDPPAGSGELVGLEWQSRSGPNELRRNDFADGLSLAACYRNEEEVREGLLIARDAMAVAGDEQLPEPANPTARGRAVKTRAFPYLPSFCVLFLFACGPSESRGPAADTIRFDTAKPLDDFDFAASGGGRPGEWSVIDNDAGRGLAQIDSEPAGNRVLFAIHRQSCARDVHVSTRFMAISGKTDQAAGVFVRFKSPDDYYAVRASALENNVRLYRVVAGRREMIGSMEINVSGQAWHTLGIAASDDRLTVFFDGRELFVATDRRFPGRPGKVGLWTQADSLTLFETLNIGSLE